MYLGSLWKEVVNNDLKCLHLRASVALDRKQWKKLVRGSDDRSINQSEKD